jgi:hypothetical protein
LTSSIGVDVIVERHCSVPCERAARATANSPSVKNALSPPVGQRKIGLLYAVPNKSTRVSTSVASCKRLGRSCTRLNISRFARSVASSSTPLAMYAQWPDATFRCATSSKSNTLSAAAGSVRTSAETAPPFCAEDSGRRRNTVIPPAAATYGLAARNLRNSRRAIKEGWLLMGADSNAEGRTYEGK